MASDNRFNANTELLMRSQPQAEYSYSNGTVAFSGKALIILLGFLATLVSIGNLHARILNDTYLSITFSYGLLTVSMIALLLVFFRFRVLDLLRPSVLAIAYIGLSMTFGSWYFGTSQARSDEWLDIYYTNVRDVIPSFTLIAFSFLAIFVASVMSYRPTYFYAHKQRANSNPLIYMVAVIIVLGVFIVDRFGAGTLATLKIGLTTSLICLLMMTNARFKWALIGLFIVLLAALSFNSKREAIFLIPCVMTVWYATHSTTKITFSNVLALVPVGVGAVILILAMSILRGYGNYNANGLFEAILLVPDYVQQDFFLGSIGNNFEVSSTFFHLTYSVDSIIKDSTLVMNGETYLRTIFIGPIGDALGFKPQSILESYTGALFPNFRSDGGSFPITSIGEAVWNFSYFAPFVLGIIYLSLDKIFMWGVKYIQARHVFGSIVFVSFVELCLFYTRGSGVDLVMAYFLASVAIACLTAPMVKLSMRTF